MFAPAKRWEIERWTRQSSSLTLTVVPTIEANGLGLYYEELGEGPPILCIHGTSSSAAVWDRDVDEISNHGRCITYDRRGCYRSERPDPYDTTAVSDHDDDAAGLLDALDATPAIIIGRSYGGGVAVDLARRYPDKVRAIALLEPAILTLDPQAMEWSDAFAERILEIAEVDPSATAQAFLTEVVGQETWLAFPNEMKQMFIANGPAIAAECRGGDLDISIEELQMIVHQALVVSAEESPEPFRRVDAILVDALPNAEHVWVEGGHFISPAQPKVMQFVPTSECSTPGMSAPTPRTSSAKLTQPSTRLKLKRDIIRCQDQLVALTKSKPEAREEVRTHPIPPSPSPGLGGNVRGYLW